MRAFQKTQHTLQHDGFPIGSILEEDQLQMFETGFFTDSVEYP